MTGDELFERREQIAEAVHALVNKMTADLSPVDDDELRQTLTEQFRFWRQA